MGGVDPECKCPKKEAVEIKDVSRLEIIQKEQLLYAKGSKTCYCWKLSNR